MKDRMFRYLEKYVGKYRVLPELDLDTNDFPRDEKGSIDPTYDDLYIPCRRGYIKSSYEPDYLCWFSDTLKTGRNIKKEFEEHKIPIYKYDESDLEVIIWFDDKYMNKVASIVKPKTSGKSIKPFSRRNIKIKNSTKYIIPEADLKHYTEITNKVTGSKMLFAKEINKSFAKLIEKKFGKEFNLKEEQTESGLSFKEYVHSIGMWNEYIKFMNDEYRKIYK